VSARDDASPPIRAKYVRGTGGSFRLDGMRDGKYTIDVSTADGLIGTFGDVNVSSSSPKVIGPLRLTAGSTVNGRAVDANGKAVAEVAVVVVGVGEQSEFARFGSSGMDGTFRIAGVREGPLTLRLLDFTGRREASVEVTMPSPASIEVGDVVMHSTDVSKQ
jgi:hypothetical protein